MISFKNIRNGTSWSGVDWSVNDKRALAEIIARVALGQQRYALNILRKLILKHSILNKQPYRVQ
ncbi:Uncharacterised protein [Yersinia frederiksenii]|uniref:Uncharacterized protein n=1 Tax=Yersinia frederiksenii TaxID=29484 RepID=A0A380SBM2_YERFR|nr:Uncharacterised protein [Yersinia frederiksenii]